MSRPFRSAFTMRIPAPLGEPEIVTDGLVWDLRLRRCKYRYFRMVTVRDCVLVDARPGQCLACHRRYFAYILCEIELLTR